MAKLEQDMGIFCISESCEFCNSKGPENLKVTDSVNDFFITFESNLQDFDVINRNKRYYDIDNVWGVLQGERCRTMIERNNFVGELGHPVPEYAGQRLSQERLADPLFKERAFIITKPKRVGNRIMATITTCGTTYGEGYAKDILHRGMIPQFSLRAFATMTKKDGKPYVNVKHISTYDSVLYPSHDVARMTSEPKVYTFSESANNVFDDTAFIYPIEEVTSEMNDSNIEYILESFDLTKDNIVGFDNTKEHAIIKFDNNVIYGNLDKNTIKKVKDFYNSF